MFPDGGEWVKEDWGPGTMLVPPSWWWHQHCVTSREPAQHLALKPSGHRHSINRLNAGAGRSTRDGGSQLNYEDVPTQTMELLIAIFAEECGKRGTPVNMDARYEG
jgi:hypothetical protein